MNADELDEQLKNFDHKALLDEDDSFMQFYEEQELEELSRNNDFDKNSLHYFSELFAIRSRQIKDKRFNKFQPFKTQKEVISHRIQLEMLLKPELAQEYEKVFIKARQQQEQQKRTAPIVAQTLKSTNKQADTKKARQAEGKLKFWIKTNLKKCKAKQ